MYIFVITKVNLTVLGNIVMKYTTSIVYLNGKLADNLGLATKFQNIFNI